MSSEFLILYNQFIKPAFYATEASDHKINIQSHNWSKLVELELQDTLLQHFFQSLDEYERKSYFQFGIECLSCFIQANFTGPELSQSCSDFFSSSTFSFFESSKLLQTDSEDLNVNIKYPILLYTARSIFKYCDVDIIINTWWKWRTILIQQHILDSLSPSLLSEAEYLQQLVKEFEFGDDNIKAELELEQAQLYNLYRQINKSESHIKSARGLLQVEYELIGKMGKRTKFQQTEIAQLTLQVKTKENCSSIQTFEIPQNVSLEDEVIFDNIEFTTEQPSCNLSISEQKLLLGALQLLIISQPQDNLYYEEVKPFVDLLLKQSNSWAIRVVILLIRCKFEAKHKRTVERCLMQCEEIVNAIQKDSPSSDFRVFDTYSTGIQPIWKTKELLGNLMLSLGLVKAALDVFLVLQNWEAVITCYTLLKLRHKAAEVIQEQLSIKPSAKLFCYLGDATDDISYYEKAWEFSKGKSFQAQYHWGLFYYHHRQYEECIPHFEKSVEINPLQPTAWLYLGYAALETEKWETAAAAYRHYTSLEPGSFETWNNLAKAYIQLGNKRGAHQALYEALRCNYDNWKVWDNLMGVSADIGHFSDIVRSYHRILELKEKHLDEDVLSVLVHSVCSDINDSDGNPASRLLSKTRELLGRITSLHPANGQIWLLYSKLAPDDYVKTQRLQRALRGFMNPDWEKSPEQCNKVLKVCKQLAESTLSEEIKATDSILNSVKLNLKSVISIVKKMDYNETLNCVNEVDELLQKLLNKIEVG